MSVIRIANPYIPRGWTGEIELVFQDPQIVQAGDSDMIVGTDPSRLWFLVAVEPVGTASWIWPQKQDGLYGLALQFDNGTRLVHNASYPSLTQGEWYFSPQVGPATVRVIIGRGLE